MMRFEVGNDRGGKPTWWLYAANNKLVASAWVVGEGSGVMVSGGVRWGEGLGSVEGRGGWQWRVCRGGSRNGAATFQLDRLAGRIDP